MGFQVFESSVGPGSLALLLLSLGIALAFEFVNGFHDTANAVATVIYTRSLRPRTAVLWSGFCNFLGVYLGGTAVAFSIVHLLPVELLLDVGSNAGLAMVIALLLAAIAWNLGTWYLGLPASSSHTLIGAILGVGLAHSAMLGRLGSGVNWSKATQVGLSLLASPLLGFAGAAGLLLLFRAAFRDPVLFAPAPDDRSPPGWIRAILLLTCTGVSLAHGSNDGQKGVGLIMLILIGLLPASFVLDRDARPERIAAAVSATAEAEILLESRADGEEADRLVAMLAEVRGHLEGRSSIREIPAEGRREVRENVIAAVAGIDRLIRSGDLPLDESDRARLRSARARLEALTDYAPTWVLIAVATALGVGTTVGWQRIVVTVGEKIGKTHLSYSQGACAELMTMATIGLADYGGYPVSTTHVLSSGVAGTMAANRSGLRFRTVRNVALAWLLTLPAAIALSAGLYLLFRLVAG